MSEYVMHEEELNGFTLKIIADEHRDNPRGWGSCAVMVCDHGRYNLGDDDGHDKARAAIRASRAYRDKWENDDGEGLDFTHGPDLFKAIQRCPDIVWLPLYLYDHSGITMSTGKFSCPWDSGQVGFIFMTKAECLREWGKGGTRLTPAIKAKAESFMTGDVETYDQYLTGDVWGYVIEDADGDEVDALWGLYGDDYAIEEGRKALQAAAVKAPAEE